MGFMMLPPEINSLRIYSGAGSAPMLQAAAAWDGLASELGSAALMALIESPRECLPKFPTCERLSA